MGEVDEGDRQHAQRTRVVRDLNLPGDKPMPGFIIEQVRGGAQGERQPADLRAVNLLIPQDAQRPLEDRRARDVALGEPQRQAIEEHVRSGLWRR